MERKTTLFDTDNLALFVAEYDNQLWVEIKETFIEMEVNGHDLVRLNLDNLPSDDLMRLAQSILTYLDDEQSIE
jgi:hypothetical protein|tara:strand:- start:920 stop:1141 length:222 start_codon:yes stop_codon:yes gene_type:complete